MIRDSLSQEDKEEFTISVYHESRKHLLGLSHTLIVENQA